MDQISTIKRPRAGRPTREQAAARHIELLDRAAAQFLDRGYDQTTIEAIAADVNMTKRTVYARYADKAALFRAALRHATEKHTAPPERIAATEGADLEQTLFNIAMLRIGLVSDPAGLKLQRIINIESYRFPDIFRMSYELGTLPTIRFLANVLEKETAAGSLAIDNPEMAAKVFMSMVVSGPVRFITSGNALSTSELNERVAFAVRLFLQGARPR